MSPRGSSCDRPRVTERRLISLPDGSVVDAVIGHRSWWLRAHEGTVRLQSMYMSLLWPQGEVVEAECECSSPDLWGHSCGIYAWRQLNPDISGSPHQVFGTVALWGEVIEHELGYRGEFALPLSLQSDCGLLGGMAALQYGLMLTQPERIPA